MVRVADTPMTARGAAPRTSGPRLRDPGSGDLRPPRRRRGPRDPPRREPGGRAGDAARADGPNGSGKSTLANTLLGNPAYTVTAGRILVAGTDITDLPSKSGPRSACSSAFQHPEEIPGVSVLNFLRQAISQRKGIDDYSVLEVRMQLIAWTKRLGMDSRSRSATSMKDFPAVRRSATRCCKWRSSNR